MRPLARAPDDALRPAVVVGVSVGIVACRGHRLQRDATVLARAARRLPLPRRRRELGRRRERALEPLHTRAATLAEHARAAAAAPRAAGGDRSQEAPEGVAHARALAARRGAHLPALAHTPLPTQSPSPASTRHMHAAGTGGVEV